jgi:hypothetical protein
MLSHFLRIYMYKLLTTNFVLYNIYFSHKGTKKMLNSMQISNLLNNRKAGKSTFRHFLENNFFVSSFFAFLLSNVESA